MNIKKESAPGTTPWTKLTTFAIAPVTNPPLAARPGKAEVRVRVVLAAVDVAGNPVTIPHRELKALLTIVDYDTGSPLPGWKIEHDTKTAPNTGMAQQSIDFWICSADPCGPDVSAAASILPPGAPKPIQTRPGSSESSFDSSVTLPALVTPLWQITTFELDIVSVNDTVYANGLQQIKLKVELAFTDQITGKPGVPTPAELASLTLAFADQGEPLPADDGSTAWWVTSPGVAGGGDMTYDNGYLPYPGSGLQAAADDSAPRASTFAYFYVACRGGAIQRVPLCAHVTCRDGWVYRTNGTDSDPCGGEHPGETSEVDVQGMPTEVGTIQQYPWIRTVLSGDDNDIDAGIRVTNPDSVHSYSLSFIDKLNSEVGIRYLTVEPQGMIQWHDKVSGERRACYTGYAAPGSTTLKWNDDVPTSPTPRPELPSADPRKGVIVLVGRQNIAYASGKPNGPCKLSTIDWYGNSNTLMVRFDSTIGDGRWKLILYR